MSVTTKRSDPEYYFDDGNVVLCAEMVEFKVHRSRLSTIAPAFKTMFDSVKAGDEKVLPLLGVSSKSFRVLLRVLYGGPEDIIKIFRGPPTVSNASDLLDLARVAHLYMASKIEAMAVEQLGVFLESCNTGTKPEIGAPFCSALVEYISSLGRGPAYDKLEKQVLAALHTFDLPTILGACEHNVSPTGRTIQASALALAMQRDAFPWSTYSKHQRTQLLVGYRRLTQAWYEFSTKTRLGAAVCDTVQDAWTRALYAPEVHAKLPEDLIGRLNVMRDLFLVEQAKGTVHDVCNDSCENWNVALELLSHHRAQAIESMHDFFTVNDDDILTLPKPQPKSIASSSAQISPQTRKFEVAETPTVQPIHGTFHFSFGRPSASPPSATSSTSTPTLPP